MSVSAVLQAISVTARLTLLNLVKQDTIAKVVIRPDRKMKLRQDTTLELARLGRLFAHQDRTLQRTRLLGVHLATKGFTVSKQTQQHRQSPS
jgi:hypothetical protein